MRGNINSLIEVRGNISSLIEVRGNTNSLTEVRGNINSLIEVRGNINSLMEVRGNINSLIEVRGNINSLTEVRGNINSLMEVRGNISAGLETYFFSHSQTFASGFNLNSQIVVSNSQLVFPTFEQFLTLRCDMPSYGYSFLGLELGSKFSPPLAEDLLAPAFFFPSFKEIHYYFPPLPSHGKTASLCYVAVQLFDCFYCRLAETSLRPRSGFGIR